MPPSAIIGMSRGSATATQSMIAVICGTPTPETMRVVQIDPGPIPTRSASAPASISALAPSAVATLPAITSISGHSRLVARSASITLREWPCAVSMHSTSTPARTQRRGALLALGPDADRRADAQPAHLRPCSNTDGASPCPCP